MRKMLFVTPVLLVALLLAGLVGLVAAAGGMQAALAKQDSDSDCQPQPDVGAVGKVGSLDRHQRHNAAVVSGVAGAVGAGKRGAQVAIAVAMQESQLRNLSGGDRDSVGMFQQRTSWGSFSKRHDPKSAATMFFKGGKAGQAGLLDIPKWQALPVTVAAQKVQVSATPDAYDRWSALAATLVKKSGGGVVTCPAGGGKHAGPKVEKAIRFAKHQLGKPYVWGATGPGSYDCSGLTMRAYQKAGIKLPRVTRAQYQAGKHVPVGKRQRGDLLFWSSNGAAGGIHHVAIALGGGRMVEAQQTGVPVKTSKVRKPGLMSNVVRPV